MKLLVLLGDASASPKVKCRALGEGESHLYAFLGAKVPLSPQQGSQGTHLHPLSCIFLLPPDFACGVLQTSLKLFMISQQRHCIPSQAKLEY